MLDATARSDSKEITSPRIAKILRFFLTKISETTAKSAEATAKNTEKRPPGKPQQTPEQQKHPQDA
jgi:hypothetical protein